MSSYSATSMTTVTPPTSGGVTLPEDFECSEVYETEANSLLPLLDRLENCRQLQSSYILTRNTSPLNWEHFLQRTRHIEAFTMTEATRKDAARVTESALIRLTEQLKNDFLFPNLREIGIQHAAGASFKHLSLLIAPTLLDISIIWGTNAGRSAEREDKAGDWSAFQLAMSSFLPDIAFYSPNITSLRLSGIPDIPHDWLSSISCLTHLCILELTHLMNLEDLKDIVKLLGSLKELEDLTLSVDGSLTQIELNSVPSEHCVQILPALHSLKITGPANVHTYFLRMLSSTELRNLTFRAPIPPSQSDIRSSFIGRKGKRGISDLPVIDIFNALNARWADTLKSIEVISSADVICDLKHFFHLKVLQRLYIKGSTVISHSNIFIPEPNTVFWPHLTFLRLSPETLSISLLQLSCIAHSAPTLLQLVVLVDLQDIPSLNAFRPIKHPLQVLCNMTDNIRQPIPEVYATYKNIENDWDEVINVARRLNFIFPKLAELRTASELWRRVKKLMDFGHDVRRDDKITRS